VLLHLYHVNLIALMMIMIMCVHMYVCCVEDSFVNSQEWTLSRSVPDLKLVSFNLLRHSSHNSRGAMPIEFLTVSVYLSKHIRTEAVFYCGHYLLLTTNVKMYMQ